MGERGGPARVWVPGREDDGAGQRQPLDRGADAKDL